MTIQELETARTELLNREKIHLEWLAYLSHDLGAPLSRMLRRVEGIQYNQEMQPSERETSLEEIHRDITELAEIVGSISQLAILESCVERSFVEIPFKPLLDETGEGFEYEASTRGIKLDISIADDVGTARIERSLIRRALENLISNAIHHTPENGLVSVRASRQHRQIQITVEDNGTGVPVQELERVFNFAFRGEGETRISKIGALGLGLALVKRVAEIHAGTVVASNVEPHGARFVLSLTA
jgi:signal transduction histidine kinase